MPRPEPHSLIADLLDGANVKQMAVLMGCNASWVYRQTDSEHCIYTRFLSFFHALDGEDSARADELAEDFINRYLALREEADGEVSHLIAAAAREEGEATAAALDPRMPKVQKLREQLQAVSARRRVMRAIQKGDEAGAVQYDGPMPRRAS